MRRVWVFSLGVVAVCLFFSTSVFAGKINCVVQRGAAAGTQAHDAFVELREFVGEVGDQFGVGIEADDHGLVRAAPDHAIDERSGGLLLFTALNNQFMSTNLNAPMASLPGVIFQYAMSSYDDWHKLAWAGALLVTATVLTLSIIARLLENKQRN